MGECDDTGRVLGAYRHKIIGKIPFLNVFVSSHNKFIRNLQIIGSIRANLLIVSIHSDSLKTNVNRLRHK